MRSADFVMTRWLGVGLAAVLAVVTLGLAATGRLALYINPESAWFAVAMAIVVLVGAVLTPLIPLGAEADHGHDHGEDRFVSPAARSTTEGSEGRFVSPAARSTTEGSGSTGEGFRSTGEGFRSLSEGAERPRRNAHHPAARSTTEGSGSTGEGFRSLSEGFRSLSEGAERPRRNVAHPAALAASVIGGVAASGVVVLALVLPPASLSVELAMSRDVGAPPLFAGSDAVTLAATGDTASFGVGEWAAVFATATNPDAFDGDAVTLTGFVTPADGESDGFSLTRLVITHCVIDAQPASIPIDSELAAQTAGDSGARALETGQWVTITGTVNSSADGRLAIHATSVEPVDEPGDPYEY